MKQFLFFILMVCLFGCSKDESVDTEGKVLRYPKLVAYITDKQVQIIWNNATIYLQKSTGCDMIYPYEIVEPDAFEIYRSNGGFGIFHKYKEIKNNGEYSYTIENLENGKPYYFYIIAKKKGYPSVQSDTIMAIPDPKTEFSELFTFDYSHTILSTSVALKINKIAYVDKYYSYNSSENCCSKLAILISNMDGSQPELLDINAYEPDWSPDNSKIVFRTENGEVNRGYGMPSRIAIFDYNTRTITRLTNDTLYNYAPVFSGNGEMILFQSNKNTINYYSTNIWLMNLATLVREQITDIEESGLIDAGKPCWIDNNSFLFQGKGNDYLTHIYKSSITEKQAGQVFESQWNDYSPSISPDQTQIAFISDRSGSNQIWLYQLENKSFKQLTGYSSEDYIDEVWCRIDWLCNSEILFTLGSSQLVKLRID